MKPLNVKSLRSYFYQVAAWAGMVDLNEALVDAVRDWASTSTVKALLQAGADVHYNEDEALRFRCKNVATVSVLDQWIRHEHESNKPVETAPDLGKIGLRRG